MYNLDKNINMRGRANVPGAKEIYLCEYKNVQNVAIDSGGTYCSGITMVGGEKFYRYDMPKGNINMANAVQISVPNGCFVMNPKLGFNMPGLKVARMKLYDFLVRKCVVAIVHTNMDQWFILGREHGLDMEGGSNFTSGKAGVEFTGANINLNGAETTRIIEIDPELVSDIMTDIVYVNVPMSLSATTITNNRIDLIWAYNDIDEQGFTIEQSLDGINFTTIYTSLYPATTYSVLGLEEETEYWFRIKTDDGMYVNYSNITDNWTSFCTFTLSATTITDHQFTISWDYNCFSVRNPVEIERSIDGTGFTLIYSTATGATSFTDTGLTFSTEYFYRIRMFSITKYTRYSNIINGTTLYFPLLLGYNDFTDNSISLFWTYGSWEVNPMEIERSDNALSGFTLIHTANSATTSFTDTGLTYNTTYYYRIRTNNGVFYSEYSAVREIQTDLYNMILTGQTISETQINLGWTMGSWAFDTTDVERSLSGTTGFTLLTTLYSGITTFSNTGLTAGVQYFYRVRSYSGATYSNYSNVADGITNSYPPQLTATTSYLITKIDLDWSYGGYIQGAVQVERSLSGNTGFTFIYQTPTGTTHFTSTGLTPLTTYYYRVRSANGVGWTDYSNVVSGTTPEMFYPLTMKVNTTGSNQTLTIPHAAGYVYDYYVNYGDGTGDKYVDTYNNANCTHTYASAGDHIIRISGTCETIYVNNGAFKNYLVEIQSWGSTGAKMLNFAMLNGQRLTTIATDTFSGFTSLQSASQFMYGNSVLTSIPTDLFKYATKVSSFYLAFGGCTSIPSIPTGLFNNCVNVTDFSYTFWVCTSLTSIPSGLFNYNTKVTNFNRTFNQCTGIGTIPANLFDYTTKVTQFVDTFAYIPITSIPTQLFRYTTEVTLFQGTFANCTHLTAVYVGLFTWATKVTDFYRCFSSCGITLGGSAPTLWTRTNPTPTGVQCFYGDTHLSNYGSIPANWK